MSVYVEEFGLCIHNYILVLFLSNPSGLCSDFVIHQLLVYVDVLLSFRLSTCLCISHHLLCLSNLHY